MAKDISSRMLADDLPAALGCGYAPSHPAVIDWIRAEARPGDTVLIMGARDPELPGPGPGRVRRPPGPPGRLVPPPPELDQRRCIL